MLHRRNGASGRKARQKTDRNTAAAAFVPLVTGMLAAWTGAACCHMAFLGRKMVAGCRAIQGRNIRFRLSSQRQDQGA